MGHTEEPVRQPEPTAECPAAATLRDTYYRPLVRLAALLTGDPASAEAVAYDALAGLRPAAPLSSEPSADVLRALQQRVLVRSRRRSRPSLPPTGIRPPRGARSPAATGSSSLPSAAEFANLPVVRALQQLPRRGREAVVLTHYLDLSEQQAAHLAGVTPAALRRTLGQAMRVLDDRFPRA